MEVHDASSDKAKMDIPRFTERIAKERNCEPDLVRAIVTDCLSALHESTAKYGIGTALVGPYWELGPLPAWHFGGILARAAECEPGELIEHYQRLDPMMERFRSISEQWDYEIKRERADDE
jgi:hypothetical protein